MRYIQFRISDSIFEISKGGSVYDKSVGSDTLPEESWYVEVGGAAIRDLELYDLEDRVEEYLNLGAVVRVEDESDEAGTCGAVSPSDSRSAENDDALPEPEIILNLWYVLDNEGIIYSLRARAYVISGSDEAKTSFLKSFADQDYLIAKPFPIPERFHLTLLNSDGTRKKYPVTNTKILRSLPNRVDLFEDAIKVLESEFPAQTKLEIPQDPVVCITPLFGDENHEPVPRLQNQHDMDV